jgi:spermidine synthase
MSGPRWIDESLHHASVSQRLLAERILLESRGGAQDVLVFENPVFGRALMIDGVVQTTERDEFIYHEMVAHVPLFAHAQPQRVLIVGGGDGGTLREVLKHRSVEQVTLVDIDATVINASRQYLPRVSDGAFVDRRTNVVIGDGFTFVRETADAFDVVIVDSTDPRGPAWLLFTTAFYIRCRERLRRGGILVAQSGVPFFQPDELRLVTSRLARGFADVAAYTAAVPTYYGGSMAFAWGSDDPALRRLALNVLEGRFAEAQVATRYYAPDVHLAAFALPCYIRALVAAQDEPDVKARSSMAGVPS